MGRMGFAQVVVLWALVVLGTRAVSFSFAMPSESLAARNVVDSARAYYMARTGINRAVSLLSLPAPDNVLAEPVTGEEEGVAYETVITNESGKIDINLVTEEVLKQVLVAAGLSAEEAEQVGDAILDWRDEDDLPRPNGAEDAFYSGLPEPIRPRNGKLACIEELLSVKGVTPEFYGRVLSRVFTVHGGSAAVNINAAPPEVLRLLPGFSPQAAEAVIAHRRESPFQTPADIVGFLTGAGVPRDALPLFSTGTSSKVYTIASTGKAGGRIVRGISCRVEMGGAPSKSVKILHWTDLVPSDEGG